MATKKPEKEPEESSGSKTFDDVTMADHSVTISKHDKLSATVTKVTAATVDKRLPPCPYGKNCYR